MIPRTTQGLSDIIDLSLGFLFNNILKRTQIPISPSQSLHSRPSNNIKMCYEHYSICANVLITEVLCQQTLLWMLSPIFLLGKHSNPSSCYVNTLCHGNGITLLSRQEPIVEDTWSPKIRVASLNKMMCNIRKTHSISCPLGHGKRRGLDRPFWNDNQNGVDVCKITRELIQTMRTKCVHLKTIEIRESIKAGGAETEIICDILLK